MSLDEEDLKLKLIVKAIRRSDGTAFRNLFDQFSNSIYRFLLFRVKDADVAEDLLQEVFIRVWKNRKSLDSDLSIQSYLFTIAANLSTNHLKRGAMIKSKEAELPLPTFDDRTPHALFENSELNERLAEAISNLSEKNRITFLMCRYEGRSYKEVAELLNISVKTVESRMTQSLKELRELLKDLKNQG